MSSELSVALVVLAGVVITAVGTLIGVIWQVRRNGRKSPTPLDEYRKIVADLRDELKRLAAHVDLLETKLAEAIAERDEAQDKVRELEVHNRVLLNRMADQDLMIARLRGIKAE